PSGVIDEPARVLPRSVGALPAGVPGNGAAHAPARGAPRRVPDPVPTRIAGEPQLTPGPGHAGRGRASPHPVRHPVAASLLFVGWWPAGGGGGGRCRRRGPRGPAPGRGPARARPRAGPVAAPPRPAAGATVTRPVSLAIPVIDVHTRLIRLGLTARGT